MKVSRTVSFREVNLLGAQLLPLCFWSSERRDDQPHDYSRTQFEGSDKENLHGLESLGVRGPRVSSCRPSRKARVAQTEGSVGFGVHYGAARALDESAARPVVPPGSRQGRRQIRAVEEVPRSRVLCEMDIFPGSTQAFNIFATRLNRKVVVVGSVMESNGPVAHILIVDVADRAIRIKRYVGGKFQSGRAI